MNISTVFWVIIITLLTTVMIVLHIAEPNLMAAQTILTAPILGADFEMVKQENFEEKIKGIQITNIIEGKLRSSTKIKEGFIVTKLNGIKVQSINKFRQMLNRVKGEIVLEGVYNNSANEIRYAFELQ